MRKFNQKTKGQFGYKIHFDRFRDIRLPLSEIRTHKFKCRIENDAQSEELWRQFKAVGDVVDDAKKGSLIWFLLQLYGFGFLFVSKEGAKNALIRKLNNEEIGEIKSASKYFQFIKNKEAFLGFINKTPRNVLENTKNNMLPSGIISSLGNIFGIDKKVSANNLS